MVLRDTTEDASGGNVTPICAVGASAGGVEALGQFFEAIGDDLGLAYVVVIHLSPDYDSQLSEILGAHTTMPVMRADGTSRLVANHVYVIPPDRELVIEGDSIRARPFTEPRGQRAPIDMFFHSVAVGRGDGIAVVLSGAGSDGALGVRKMKDGGGVIFVQDPQEAAYPTMPGSAIATGAADFVMPVAAMADCIAEVARAREALRRTGEEEAEENLRRILGFLRARTGHDFSSYKKATVMRRVARRIQVTRVQGLAAYDRHLHENPEEADELFGDLLISVTAFFRDAGAFETLARDAIGPLFDRLEPNRAIRIWSVGCATGEEAYSLAMLVLEEAERRRVNPPVQIFATDLDERALAAARAGRYPRDIAADMSEVRLRRFFTDDGAQYRIRKEVRDMVLFAHHSALKDPPFMHIDLVTCRNLLIYLERDMQRQLLSLFHYALRPGGFLFLGSAESIDTRPELFTPVQREARLYAAKPKGLRGLEVLTHFPREHDPKFGHYVRLASEPHRPPVPAPVAHKQALEDLAPPSALVDEDQRVLNLSRTAGQFIRPSEGPMSVLLPELVRPELRAELRRALSRALDSRETTLTLPVPVDVEGATRRILMHVAPVAAEAERAAQALVLFIDAGPGPEAAPREVPGAVPDAESLRRLEEELRTTREHLVALRREHESAIQELRVANEELQSINEEYRSTAEELETSKEELQSINEELSTVNAELKRKLDAIASAHSDLQNLINATEIGTLFLDTSLRIRMLTPSVERLFSVTDSDVGRPISDFTHKLVYDRLEEDVAQVLRDLNPIGAEVATRTGGWLMMRLRPYRTVDDRVEGVVLSFVDITERRAAEQRLRESEERYRRLFEGMDEGYLLIEGDGGDMVLRDGNPAARRLLNANLVGHSLAVAEGTLGEDWCGIIRTAPEGGTRHDIWSAPLERWFEVGISRIDARRLAVLFQDITERRRHVDERELLVGELNHRVKNMLAVVQSVARQTLRSTPDPAAFTDAFARRLEALAVAHGLLTEHHWRGSDLRDLARRVLGSFGADDEARITLDGPSMRLSPNSTISLTMALHELATNATKYGALQAPGGHVTLSWSLERGGGDGDGIFRMAWNEEGGPAVVPPVRSGFGARVLKSVARELGGDVSLEYPPEGFRCRFVAPSDGIAGAEPAPSAG